MLKRNFHLPTINFQTGFVSVHGDYTSRSCVGKGSFLFRGSRLVRGSVSVARCCEWSKIYYGSVQGAGQILLYAEATTHFTKPLKIHNLQYPAQARSCGPHFKRLGETWQKHLEDAKNFERTWTCFKRFDFHLKYIIVYQSIVIIKQHVLTNPSSKEKDKHTRKIQQL